jgi:hypothetical protein
MTEEEEEEEEEEIATRIHESHQSQDKRTILASHKTERCIMALS